MRQKEIQYRTTKPVRLVSGTSTRRGLSESVTRVTQSRRLCARTVRSADRILDCTYCTRRCLTSISGFLSWAIVLQDAVKSFGPSYSPHILVLRSHKKKELGPVFHTTKLHTSDTTSRNNVVIGSNQQNRIGHKTNALRTNNNINTYMWDATILGSNCYRSALSAVGARAPAARAAYIIANAVERLPRIREVQIPLERRRNAKRLRPKLRTHGRTG
ncbi:hypothetical protein EVAR_102601_1 [Eumeta japonica]|uniref:Uncharacterized protein n=1 Tax=Eumeta variegata TaxID=151549 RepID=A0A4C1TUN2_EUMVA|nr:hypothetical protein EVAR_102601_1 [Eumeta japonica]